MKYLDIQSFVSINRDLDVVSTGDSVISGRLEAYSCKTVGSDKKLFKEIQTELSKSPNYSSFHNTYSKSPSSSLSKSPSSSFSFSKSPSSSLNTSANGSGNNKDSNNNYKDNINNVSSSSNNNSTSKSPSSSFLAQNTSTSSDNLSSSPLSTMTIPPTASIKTFVYLIATLNASYLDYDFSNASPEQFKREPNRHMVMNSINTTLAGVVPNYNTEVKDRLWAAVDVEVDLDTSEIYSYIPDLTSDPFTEDGIIWSFNYFFYGKALKRIIFFTCRAVSKSAFEQQLGKSADVLTKPPRRDSDSASNSDDDNPWTYEEAIIGTMEFDNTTFAP